MLRGIASKNFFLTLSDSPGLNAIFSTTKTITLPPENEGIVIPPPPEESVLNKNLASALGTSVKIQNNPFASEYNNFLDENFDIQEFLKGGNAGIAIETGGEIVDPIGDTIQFSAADMTKSSLEIGQFTDRNGRITVESYDKSKMLENLFESKKLNDKKQLGYQFEEFIVDCLYKEFKCVKSDFIHFYSSTLGNCYTFNSGWNSTHPVYSSFIPGPRSGLSIILYLDSENYLPLTPSLGAKIVIHPQNVMPFPEDEGFLLSPGESTEIAIKKSTLERAGGVYNPCQSIDGIHIQENVFEELYPVRYSRQTCLRTCYQKIIIEKCKCYDVTYPYYGKAFNYQSITACQYVDFEQRDCMNRIEKEYNKNIVKCDCPVACR
ncbi:hypothetical protein A3Q56_07812 [Intoshia linei]|uniref:Amiloride-sensitive sodium channel subunit beta n=1 Tax=Intoshia linei TaxID=1819745 RepID=A0A177AR34_9BILA|nr:hypothetical protein A3Q56_07812 [Intoshia linei]